MNKVKLYEIDENESEIFKISLVEEPAVNLSLVALSKQKEKPKFIALSTNEEKRMVYSCALRCNYPIYRFDGENEYYIKFSPKAVENLSRKFMVNGFQNSWSTDHLEDVNGLSVVESWIVTDVNLDKTKALNMDADIGIGDWIVGCYVDNDEVWERVKNNEFGGFSVEALCNLNEINKFKKDNKMEINETFWDKMKEILFEALGKKEELSVEEPNEEVNVEDAVEDVIEETIEEVKEEETIVDEVIEEPVEETKDEINVEEYINKINELEAKVAELVGVNAELSKQNAELSKQPSAEKVNIEASKSDNKPSFLDFASGRIKY